MFDWLWCNWYKVKNNVYPTDKSFAVETIDIRINQALQWMDYHFYITINGVYEYHISASEYEFKQFQEIKSRMEYSRKKVFSYCNLLD